MLLRSHGHYGRRSARTLAQAWIPHALPVRGGSSARHRFASAGSTGLEPLLKLSFRARHALAAATHGGEEADLRCTYPSGSAAKPRVRDVPTGGIMQVKVADPNMFTLNGVRDLRQFRSGDRR